MNMEQQEAKDLSKTASGENSLAEIAADIKKWSRANPVEAALIGVGVGFLFGVLLRKTFSRSE